MWYPATILSRRQLSPTVTGITLKIDPHSISGGKFTFLPGQWVDFKPRPSFSWKHPDGARQTIGGYSLTSIPQSLPQIELAIQPSSHHVADWVTAHARPNDLVDVRVGGSFTYNSGFDITISTDENEHHQRVAVATNRLLFIAGGVGINPLFSMIQQWRVDQAKQNNKNSRAMLLYSGRSKEELLFVNQLYKLTNEKPGQPRQFRVICTTTQGQQILDEASDTIRVRAGEVSGVDGIAFRVGRIDLEMIKSALKWLNQSGNSTVNDEIETPSHGGNTHEQEQNMIADAVFVCGPPGMPESMMKIFSEEKLVQSTDNVHFEKWW